MTSWRVVHIIAGIFIMISLALGAPSSPLFIKEWFLAFTFFVGANIFQSGLTRWCLMETLLRRLGIKAGC